jgi:hypothetical protein
MHGVPNRAQGSTSLAARHGCVAAATALLALLLTLSALYGWSRRQEAVFEAECLRIAPGTPSAAMVAQLDPASTYVHVLGCSGPGGHRPCDLLITRRYRSYRFQCCEALLDSRGNVVHVAHTRGTDFDHWMGPAHPHRARFASLLLPLLP